MKSSTALNAATGVGHFYHLRWAYDGAFEQLFGYGEGGF